MRVEQIAPNMAEVEAGSVVILFSYKTPVAARVDGKHYRTAEYFSRTTEKHIKKWLGGVQAGLKPQAFFDGLGNESKT